MAKGEIARCEQFLLLSQSFQKLSAADVSNTSTGGKGLIKGKIVHDEQFVFFHSFRKSFDLLLTLSNIQQICIGRL